MFKGQNLKIFCILSLTQRVMFCAVILMFLVHVMIYALMVLMAQIIIDTDENEKHQQIAAQNINRFSPFRINLTFSSGGSRISRWGGGGGADLRRLCFSAKTYAKTKELDSVWGECMPTAPPGSANAQNSKIIVGKYVV